MTEGVPGNDAEILRETPEFYWRPLEYGFRCSACKAVSVIPFKYCPRCGSFMERVPDGFSPRVKGGEADDGVD